MWWRMCQSVPPHTEGVCGGGCVSSPSHRGGMWRMCQFPLTQRGYAVEDVSVPPHTEGVCGGGCVSSPSHGGGMRWRMCQFPLTQRGYAVEDVLQRARACLTRAGDFRVHCERPQLCLLALILDDEYVVG